MDKFPKKYNIQTDNLCYEGWQKKFSQLKNTAHVNLIIPMLPMLSRLHLGHMFGLVSQDVFVRTLALLGTDVYWNLGMTHHSFFSSIGIHDFSEHVYSKKIIKQILYNRKQLQSFGLACDFSNFEVTLSEKFTNYVRDIFSDLYKKNKIYEDKNIIFWDKKNKNILSKTEITYKKINAKKYNIRYFVDMKRDSVVVGTFRPDTVFADVALAVNPSDKRYKKLIGKNAIVPIVNKSIPIIGDEEINIQENNGIVRITPCHDEFGLKIAQKHNLPLDHYAIDFNGCFTENAGTFAGKNIDDFSQNIIQFLDDISNIDSISEVKYDVPVCKKTGEHLELILTDQWFIKFKDESLFDISTQIDSGKIKIYPEIHFDDVKQTLHESMAWCISKQNCFGQKMPIRKDQTGMSFIIDDDFLIEKYTSNKSNKSKKFLLSLVIFNLIADGVLETKFTVEKLIDILFSESLSDFKKNKLEIYLDIFSEKYVQDKNLQKEIQEVRKILAQREFSNMAVIIDVLEETYLVNDLGNSHYSFGFDVLTSSKNDPKQVEYIFDYGFSRILGNMKTLLQDKNTDKKENIIITGNTTIFSRLGKLILFSYDYTKVLFDKIYLNSVLLDKNGKKISFINDTVDPYELINRYGSDCVRLFIFFQKEGNGGIHVDDQEFIGNYMFIEKLWNAARFVTMQNVSLEKTKSNQNINFLKIQEKINKNVDKLTDFDQWILYSLKGLGDEMKYNCINNSLLSYGKRVLEFVKKDFCDLYMEISKVQKGEITDLILLFALLLLLKLLHPYIPFVTEKLWNTIGVEGSVSDTLEIHITEVRNKNYKINLFFDIVSKIFELKEKIEFKQHDLVQICIQASPDFLSNIKKYETILMKIAKISSIDYLAVNQNIPLDYKVGNVIDINVGIKKMERKSKKENLRELEKELENKKEYLQYLRTLIAKTDSVKNNEMVKQKEQEMEELNDQIDNLIYEIDKLKIGI